MDQFCLISGVATILGVTLASFYSNRFFPKQNKKLNDSNNNSFSSSPSKSSSLNNVNKSSQTTMMGLSYEQTFNIFAMLLLLALTTFTYFRIISSTGLQQMIYGTFCLILIGNFFQMLKGYSEFSIAYREKLFRHRITSFAQLFFTALLCLTLKVWSFSDLYLCF